MAHSSACSPPRLTIPSLAPWTFSKRAPVVWGTPGTLKSGVPVQSLEGRALVCISLPLSVKALCSLLHPGIFLIFPTPYVTARGQCGHLALPLAPGSVSAILTTECISQLLNPATAGLIHHCGEEGGRSRRGQRPSALSTSAPGPGIRTWWELGLFSCSCTG